MQRKGIAFIFFSFIVCFSVFAQSPVKYRVYFKNKANQQFDPHVYFDQKAIERRLKQGLPLSDSTDFPVNPKYLTELERRVDALKMHSRWFNAAVVMATQEQIEEVAKLPFVAEIEASAAVFMRPASRDDETPDDISEDKNIERQIERMGAELLHAEGINGNGVRVAIFDVGFSGADKHPAFTHLFEKGKIKGTRDFVKKRDYVYDGGWHGTAVWSCIAGKTLDGRWLGLAWDAEFLLARTELERSEPFAEEEYWVAAAEWADKQGADIINSSLGYTDNRYFPEQMNGKTSFISRGANMAAKKGMLVVNAAGNEGSGRWGIIGAPADADSVLAVGGLEPCCDYHIDFSSFGPTADKRLKPNVAAQGRTKSAKSSGYSTVDGTSFASPLMAGFAACMMQKHPELKNMELFRLLEKSGHLYPYFDYAHGYGIPHASRFNKTNPAIEPTFDVVIDTAFSSINIVIKENHYDSTATESSQLLYVSEVDSRNYLIAYRVIDVGSLEPYKFRYSPFNPASRLRFHYKGYTFEQPIP